MNRILIALFLIVLMSCDHTSEDEIERTEDIRKTAGLKSLDSLVLDSIFRIKPYSEEWVGGFIKDTSQLIPDIFQTVEVYTNPKRNFSKRVCFKYQHNDATLLWEEDRYMKSAGQLYEAILLCCHDYKKNRSTCWIDSMPSHFLIERNRKELDKAVQNAKIRGGYICGTSYIYILEKDFPLRYGIVRHQVFDSLRPSFE